MNNLFNSIDSNLNDSLSKCDKCMNDDIRFENLVNDIKNCLTKHEKISALSKLPQNTLFEINEIEKEYVVCYFNHEKYDIPKEIVDLKDLEDFNMRLDRLQLQKDGLYHIVKY